MTNVKLICKTCGAEAKRPLNPMSVGVRGVHETESRPALCPKGHGPMVREDGGDVMEAGSK